MASPSFSVISESSLPSSNKNGSAIVGQSVAASTNNSPSTELLVTNAEDAFVQAEASGGTILSTSPAGLKPEEIRKKLDAKEFTTRKRIGSRYSSSNWNSFHEIVRDDCSVIPYYVVCIYCNKLQRYEPEKGTNNLTRHAQACTKPNNTINKFFGKRTMSLDKADKTSMLNAAKRFCYNDLRPFTALEGDGLIELLHAVSTITSKHGILTKDQIKEIVPVSTTVSIKASKTIFSITSLC